MKYLAILITSVFILTGCQSTGSTHKVQPKGEFAEIDVQEQNKMASRLKTKDQQAVETVLANPQNYNPVVLYTLSEVLFKTNKEQSLFWFYSAQLKARSDANKSLDKSAGQAVAILNDTFGPKINQYAFSNIELLKTIVPQVVKRDEDTPRNYDPRWISLHGMDAFTSEVVAFEPKEKWPDINKSTREQYLNGFNEAMNSL